MRRVTAMFLAAGLVAGLAGCGGQDETSTTPARSATVSPSDSPVPKSPENTPDAEVAAPTWTPEAGRKFGKDAIVQAYAESVDCTLAATYRPELIASSGKDLSGADFKAVTDCMSESAAASYMAAVRDRESDQGNRNVLTMSFFGLSSEYYTVRDDVDPTKGERITKPRVTVGRVDGEDRMVISYDVNAQIRMTDAKGNFAKIPLGKEVTYWMKAEKTPQGQKWVIDGWQARIVGGTATPDTAN